MNLSSLSRPLSLRATRTDANGETVIRLEGLLDALSVGDAASLFGSLPRRPALAVRLDLSSLRLLDGRGVAAIMALSKRLRETGGRLCVVGAREQPLVLLRLMRLDGLMRE